MESLNLARFSMLLPPNNDNKHCWKSHSEKPCWKQDLEASTAARKKQKWATLPGRCLGQLRLPRKTFCSLLRCLLHVPSFVSWNRFWWCSCHLVIFPPVSILSPIFLKVSLIKFIVSPVGLWWHLYFTLSWASCLGWEHICVVCPKEKYCHTTATKDRKWL